MLALLLRDLANLDYYLGQPLFWIVIGFQLWMLVDAIRRQEWLWVFFLVIGSGLAALLYFFLVYRTERATLPNFELPGAHQRQRIRELETQIHHLDKAHHHLQLGDVYFHQGKLAKAETAYRAALERDPEETDARAHLGQCLLRQRKPAEALPFLEAVCTQDPKHDYGHTLMALAETQEAMGQREKAVAAWKQVLENYSYPRARVQLAELHLADQHPELARKLLEEVLADDQHSPAFQRRREKAWVSKARSLLGRLR